MAPHQERVVAEKSELDEKIGKLKLFAEGGIFENLADAEKERLQRQLSFMNYYSAVLRERIAAFPAEASADDDGTGGVPPTGGDGGPHH